MALSTTFNRLKREIGIKKCVIVEGNVGDVYLNDKKQIVDLKQYLMDISRKARYEAFYIQLLTVEETAFAPVTGSQIHFLQEIGADRNVFKSEKW